ncbi:hypothetical protein KZZ52_13730 [Dactylosporangium sp. AC04546]|uniref:hypothetical protein n=1 Tax=Dactylosporangium sp. AC04546 TaxID=2862460 RepID=UPI001EDE62C7|nr:hypothetical protein [Dactylosporangium sp. AC04546]WVK86388.1 hypothetical protein KZZ52_13730 [Dactylosporangium sp. AC04546]
MLGWPRAAFAATTFAGATALAIGVLTLNDSTARYAAVILLIGLCGLAVGVVVQLRHVLTHPVVADDEVSLTADIIMRVDDARGGAAPTAVWSVWSLPVVSVFSTAFGWWIAAWLVFIVLSVIAQRYASSSTMAAGSTSNPTEFSGYSPPPRSPQDARSAAMSACHGRLIVPGAAMVNAARE